MEGGEGICMVKGGLGHSGSVSVRSIPFRSSSPALLSISMRLLRKDHLLGSWMGLVSGRFWGQPAYFSPAPFTLGGISRSSRTSCTVLSPSGKVCVTLASPSDPCPGLEFHQSPSPHTLNGFRRKLHQSPLPTHT